LLVDEGVCYWKKEDIYLNLSLYLLDGGGQYNKAMMVKYFMNSIVSLVEECRKNRVNLFDEIIHEEVTWYLTSGRMLIQV